jgi:hypothetical protein
MRAKEKNRQRFNKLVTDMIESHQGSPVFGAELGVWQGQLSAALLESFPQLHLLMVDRWMPYETSRLGKRTDREGFLFCMSQAMRSTDQWSDRRLLLAADTTSALRLVPDGSLDFVFVDADHVYEAVLTDLNNWWPKLRKHEGRTKGLMCGHDYCSGRWAQTKRAIDTFAASVGGRIIVVDEQEGLWQLAFGY